MNSRYRKADLYNSAMEKMEQKGINDLYSIIAELEDECRKHRAKIRELKKDEAKRAIRVTVIIEA